MASKENPKDKDTGDISAKIVRIVLVTLIAVDGLLNDFANTKKIGGDIAEFVVNAFLFIFG